MGALPDGMTFVSGGNSVGVGFVEVKATKGKLGYGALDMQLARMIDTLAEISKLTGAPTELHLVTTTDATVEESLVDYATNRGVVLAHSTVSYDPDTGNIKVDDAAVLNPSVTPHPDVVQSLHSRYLEMPLYADFE